MIPVIFKYYSKLKHFLLTKIFNICHVNECSAGGVQQELILSELYQPPTEYFTSTSVVNKYF